MAKQEEIREGLFLWMGAYGIKEDNMVKAGIELFRFLHSQGVVIKVDRELPKQPYGTWNDPETEEEKLFGLGVGYEQAQKDMAGYVAVEPLVLKEKSNVSP